MDRDLTAHARRNQIYWSNQAGDYVEPGRRSWSEPDPSWGIWHIPEADVGALPAVAGLDAAAASGRAARVPHELCAPDALRATE